MRNMYRTVSNHQLGVERMLLAFLLDAYDEEVLTDSKGKEDVRTVLQSAPGSGAVQGSGTCRWPRSWLRLQNRSMRNLTKHFQCRLRCDRIYRQAVQERR